MFDKLGDNYVIKKKKSKSPKTTINIKVLICLQIQNFSFSGFKKIPISHICLLYKSHKFWQIWYSQKEKDKTNLIHISFLVFCFCFFLGGGRWESILQKWDFTFLIKYMCAVLKTCHKSPLLDIKLLFLRAAKYIRNWWCILCHYQYILQNYQHSSET